MGRAATRFLCACALLFATSMAGAAPEDAPKWGTASPTILEYASPAGDVLVICQARTDTNGDGKVEVTVGHHGEPRGDTARPYLCLGPGPGEEIDEFVAGSPAGGHVVVVQKGKLLLVDAKAGTRVDLTALGADARDHGVALWPHRAACFDARGRRVAWFRKAEKGHGTIQVRDLASGVEAVVEAGPVLPMLVWFDGGGGWLWMHAVVEDTDKDGVLSFPHFGTTLDDRRCRGEPASYSTFGWSGDRLERFAAPAQGGAPRPAKGAVDALGVLLLRRGPDGAFLTEDARGKERTAVPAEAAAHLHGIWREGAVAVLEDTAGAMAGRYRLLRISGTSHADAWSQKQPRPRTEDEEAPDLDRYWRFTSRDGGRLADLTTGLLREFVPGVRAQHGGRLLLVEDLALSVMDLTTDERAPLDATLEASYPHPADFRQAGAVVLVRGHVIDLAAARYLGSWSEDTLALASDGRVLVPREPGWRGLVQGPLRWTAPTPRPTSGVPGAGK